MFFVKHNRTLRRKLNLKKKFEESTAGTGNEDEERKSKLLDSYCKLFFNILCLNNNLIYIHFPASVDFRIKEVANFALTAIEAFESHDIR